VVHHPAEYEHHYHRDAEPCEEELVPFSCKRRGICPSCTGRRMAELAAHLVDAARGIWGTFFT